MFGISYPLLLISECDAAFSLLPVRKSVESTIRLYPSINRRGVRVIAGRDTHWALGPFLKLSLSYFSSGWSLVTLLLLSSGPAYGEWVVVEKNNPLPGLQTVYADSDTIRSEGNLVTIWLLIDFDKGIGPLGHGPRPFFSTKTRKQFDCANKRLRWLAYMEFSGHMGAGLAANKDVDKDNWYPVEPASLDHALWEVVCGKK